MPDVETTTNAHLLTELIGDNAIAQTLIKEYGSLTNLACASIDELCRYNGIGQGRAKAIKSAFTLARRLSKEAYPESPLLDTPERVADLLREENRMYEVEHFQVLLLNTRRRLIRVVRISQGTVDTVLTHPRDVFRTAIVSNASAIILVHNHPSGDPSPSESDIRTIRDLIRAGKHIKIEILDHIILGRRTDKSSRDFASLRELGFFYD